MTKVRFVGADLNKVIDIKIGTLILDGAQSGGVELPYGCRYGSCYACSVEVIKGIENIDCPNLKPVKNKTTTILTCISKIKKNGEIVLRL